MCDGEWSRVRREQRPDTARFANARSYPGDDRAVKRAGTGVTRRDETG